MKRIELAGAEILESARMYLAKLPLEYQNMSVDEKTNRLVNNAIPLLFNRECAIRLENSQNSPIKNPFKCPFCGVTYEYGDPNHSHN